MTYKELSDGWQAFDRLVDDADGELSPASEAVLDELIGAESHKVDGTVRYIRYLEASSAAKNLAAERYLRGAKAENRKADRIKEVIKYYLLSSNRKEIKTELHRVSVQSAGGQRRMEVADIGQLPPSYLKTKTETVVDKELLRSDLEAGKTVPGATLHERGTLLRVS